MFRKLMIVICVFALLAACDEKKAAPTATPVPPTHTAPPPPTATLIPSTNTAPPPPTATVIPPIDTVPARTATRKPTSTQWPTQPPRTPHPSGRVYSSLVYNPKTDQALLFSGTSVNALGEMAYDTWLFDPKTTSWKSTKNMPVGCYFADPGVFDTHAERVLAYCSNSHALWEYDFTTNLWYDRKAKDTPKGTNTARMAYDDQSDKTILIGGISFTTSKMLEETWAYDYDTNAWTKMSPKIQPPGLYTPALAYDAESDRVLLYGGVIFTGNWNGDNWGDAKIPDNLMWAYDYNTDTWESFPVEDGPNYPLFVGLCKGIDVAYDPGRDRTVFFWDYELWSYDYNTNTWEEGKGEIVKGPRGRQGHAMTYLTSLNRLMVFGGTTSADIFALYEGDTWLYDFQTGDWTKVGP